jgi:putative N6-adenine-specific DNA methylase
LIADAALEQSIRDELRQRVNFEHTIRIFGSDKDPRAVSIAASNVMRAYDIALGRPPQDGIQNRVSFEKPLPGLPDLRCIPMEDARPPAATAPGAIITNPPYGKRLGESGEAEAGYAAMSALAQGFPGWKLAVITSHPGFESFFGHKADTCREITNGAIPSYFFQYESL